MSLLLRRLHSTSTSTTTAASTAASLFLAQTNTLPPLTHSQTLEPTQLHRLAATLARPPPSKPSAAIPACHHLVYFTPAAPSPALAPDGSDAAYNAPAPFTRRMWAGGELAWAGRANLLRLGQTVRETTAVRGAEAKRTRDGADMVVVGVEKVFENAGGRALVDRRNWVFRQEISGPSRPTPRPARVPFPEGRYVRDLLMTPVMLFRFSALTFNGHKIHYNREWCREVEGHRDLVVHGPLNLVHMVDFWRDVITGGDEEVVPKRVVYRATSPLYAGEPYRIVMDEEREGVSEVRIVDAYGDVCMVGKIERFQEE